VDEGHWFDDMTLPALLRAAQAPYRSAIRVALVEAGFEDMPRNGAYVIGGMARTGVPLSRVVKGLDSSKQAVGQLVDTLVARGYLERAVDPDDRRRLTVSLTERGTAAARTVRSAVEMIDSALDARVSQQDLAHTRATLGALVALGHDGGPS
jgi:DNA-binding MarR family transcriptional regulator